MKDIIIIGSGGFAKEVFWLIERINKTNKIWNVIGFTDNNLSKIQQNILGVPILGDINILDHYKDAFLICAIGSSEIRKKVVKEIENNYQNEFATLIDPQAIISDYVEIGKGAIICAGTIITVDIKIGNHVIINLDCTIGHDVIIKDFVTIYPSVNVSGSCFLNDSCELGTGTQVIQQKTIGSNTIVGAGSVVLKDLQDNCTAVGIPAKIIKYNS